jgi:hypothetical protein
VITTLVRHVQYAAERRNGNDTGKAANKATPRLFAGLFYDWFRRRLQSYEALVGPLMGEHVDVGGRIGDCHIFWPYARVNRDTRALYRAFTNVFRHVFTAGMSPGNLRFLRFYTADLIGQMAVVLLFL